MFSRARKPKPTPPAAAHPDNWVETEFDCQAVADLLKLDWAPPPGWPLASIQLVGDGEAVRTAAQLIFPKPLALKLEPWKLPRDFIDGDLASFIAVRGVTPWLQTWKAWNDLGLGAPPRQIFAWGLRSFPMLTYAAVAHPQAAAYGRQVADFVLNHNQAWFGKPSDMAGFARSPDGKGVQWKGLPYLSPWLTAATNGTDFVLGGLGPLTETNNPLPAELLGVLAQTNLVAYSWDHTGSTLGILDFYIAVRAVRDASQPDPGRLRQPGLVSGRRPGTEKLRHAANPGGTGPPLRLPEIHRRLFRL